MRVLIWMSCTGWKYTMMPGMLRHLGLQARDDLSTMVALRLSRGFSVILRWPALGVGLMALTPTTVTTPSTSGSARNAVATVACRRSISAKETSGPASSTAVIEPGILRRQEALGHDRVERRS